MPDPAHAQSPRTAPGLSRLAGVESLVALLQWRAAERADAPLYVWSDDAGAERSRTFAELDRRARAIARELQRRARPGDRALLLYAPGLEYIEGFFGCLYAGVVAVPAYPPDPVRLARSTPRLLAQVSDAGARFALTTSALAAFSEPLFEAAPGLRELSWISSDEVRDEEADAFREVSPKSSALAFLQYTSGSTGSPRGVMLSHRNLLDNLAVICGAFELGEETVSVSWLPPYHDMGLIGGILGPLYCGRPAVLMSPLCFLYQPFRWLDAISRHRASVSGGPNFAYELCARKISPEQRARLDLRSWRLAFNGAEPIRPETLDRFSDAFSTCGFRRNAFYPCYGLAESTLLVTGPTRGDGPLLRRLDRDALAKGQVSAAPEGDAGQVLVSSGRPRPGQEIAIVDPVTLRPAPADAVGEVWLRSSSVASGYWNRSEETAALFQARLPGSDAAWLRTGDLGFLQKNELFITGRLKDLLILRGRNLYPQDLEQTAEGVNPALRPGCGAAFSVDAEGGEALIVVHEVDAVSTAEPAALAAQVSRAIGDAHGVTPAEVVLIRRGTIPKTSSGKIQRKACRNDYLAGALEVVVRTAPAKAPSPAMPEDPGQLTAFVGAWIAARIGCDAKEIDLALPVAQHGLDSLGALELAAALEDLVQRSVPVSTVLASPSLRRLAEEVLSLPGRGVPSGRELEDTPPDQGHPLTSGQEGLWYFQQVAPSSAAYVLASAARVEHPLDIEALRRAIGALAARHPMLGARFEQRGGHPVQYPGALEPAFREHACAGWSDEALHRRLQEEARRPFDLAREAPCRVEVFTRGPEDHAVFFAVHHLVADFWSLGIILADLGALYPAARAGVPAPLPPVGVRYAAHARRQRELLAGPAGAALERFWRSALGEELPVLDLPTDHPRPPVRRFRGALRAYELEPKLAGQLAALARAEGTTLFCALLSATQAVLGRLSGQDTFFVGTPMAGRTSSDLFPVVGYFANPVPLRADLRGDPSFRELLARVRSTLGAAIDHQELPFPVLVERLNPPRDRSRAPIFQVLFVLQRPQRSADPALPGFLLGREGQRLRLGELELRSVTLDQKASQFDLTIMAAETERGLSLSVQYDSDLFEPTTVDRMFELLEALLRSAVARPEGRLSQLSALPDAHAALVLDQWNRTPRDYPSDRCIHDLVKEQAHRTPEAIAVECGARRLTYREMDARASRLARLLCATFGPRSEARIGLRVERSERMVVAMLGVLKAGMAYVPIDVAAPPARVQHILTAAGACALLWDGATPPPEPLECKGLELERCEERARELPNAPLGRLAHPRGLAYIVFTSGTTGQPRGVMVEHRSAVNFLTHVVRCDDITAADRVLQQASPAFDFSVGEIFPVLLAGGTLVIAPAEELRDPEALLACLSRERISVLNTVPAILAMLNRLPEARLPHLRLLFSGGEALLFAEIEKLRERVVIGNAYGPTETTVASTYCLVHELGGLQTATVPIGRPLANTRVYVLDHAQRPVPLGAVGELYVAGDGVSRGYVGQPAATAEKFLPDPFGPAGGRMYRTGDLARWLAHGSLEFLGRADHQVKLRGFRIELLEIEAVLSRHPDVRECAVLMREDAPGQKRLVAYILRPAESLVRAEELQRFLADELPPYMVPCAFILLSQWPLTTNGKVDRSRLPRPEEAAEPAMRLAPRSPLEAELATLWREILPLAEEELGVHDDFFSLGGSSLHAAQLASRLRDAYGVELPLGKLMQRPTIAALAELLDAGSRLHRQGAAIPRRNAREAPLSFAQERLWLTEQLRPGTATYLIPVALRLCGELDGAALERALGELLERHEVLRTRFELRAEGPVQVVAPREGSSLPVDDLRSLAPAERSAEARARLRAEAERPFDLSRDAPIRARLLRLEDQEHWLCLVLHHIAADGWSLSVLMEELAALYGAFIAGCSSPLPELPIQYADFAAWQRESEPRDAAALSFFREQLKGAPPGLELPTDRPRPAVASGRGGVVSFRFAPTSLARLKGLAREEGATLFMALLAGVQVLAHRYTGQTAFVLTTAVANRDQPEVERLLGFFVNLLPLRAQLEGGSGFREVLRRARRTAAEAFERKHIPFERILDAAGVPRGGTRVPFCDLVLVLQNAPAPALSLSGLSVERLPLETGTARFDLTLSLVEEAEGLSGTWEFDADLFDASSIERMGQHLARLLDEAVAHPDLPVEQLQMVSPEELSSLALWARMAPPKPRRCIHALFSEQAARTPGAIALETSRQRVTYAELDARTDRMAHALRRRGVGAEARVGVCLDRSIALIEALLAILKAGGAYVPIDPALPEERVAWMLRDAEARWLIASPGLAEPGSAACERIDIEALASEISPSGALEADVGPDHLAYVMYTSGSTGQPKGVCIPHRGVVRLVTDTDYVELGPEQVHLQLAPSSFDASTFEIWGALLNGGRAVLPRPGELSPREIGEAIGRHGVTTLWLTAGLFHLLLDEMREALRPVKQLLAGGDILSVSHVARALRELPGCSFVNGYGPTENTTFSCCYRVREVEEGQRSIPIGRPIRHSTAWVLDERMDRLPIGVEGELYLGGEGLSRCYLGRPELTATQFVPDPFGGVPGARLYRTGDRVRWCSNGTLEFLGRRDNQVKIRGYRVELGEVEAALGELRGVRAAAAVVVPAPGGDKRLVAYACPAEGGALDPAELRAALGASLPGYMVPDEILTVEQLPVGPTGKIDRRALSALSPPVPSRSAPWPGLEARLACLWAELLGTDGVGREDDFFALGGTSLTAMRLVARVERDLGASLPLLAVYEAGTLSRVAERITRAGAVSRPSVKTPSLVQLEERGAGPPLILAHAASGSSLCYVPLVRALGPERQVIGLDAPALCGDMPPRATLEEMAADHIAALLSRPVTGELLLAGWSLGGLIAFEMACQLEERGLPVGALVLVDSWVPQAPLAHLDPAELSRAALLAALLRDLSAGARGPALTVEDLADLPEEQQIIRAAEQASAAGVLRPDTAVADLLRMLAMFEANLRALATWTPRFYAGAMHFIRASQSPAPSGESASRWRKLARSVEIHAVAGDHHSILRPPGVGALAERLRAILARPLERTP